VSVVTLCALLLAGLAPAATAAVEAAPPAARSCDGGDGVYLYDGKQYTGRCIRLTEDEHDLSIDSFNNIVSSLRVVGNWTATLFVNQNYGGDASTFIDDDPDLSNNRVGDNNASSARIRPGDQPSEHSCNGADGVYLYEHPNYQGRCLKLTGDAGDLRVYGFDDIVSSVHLVGNWTVTLYRDLYGTGIASTFAQDDANLVDDAVGENQATSASVRRR